MSVRGLNVLKEDCRLLWLYIVRKYVADVYPVSGLLLELGWCWFQEIQNILKDLFSFTVWREEDKKTLTLLYGSQGVQNWSTKTTINKTLVN